jgi:hypothetical protein
VSCGGKRSYLYEITLLHGTKRELKFEKHCYESRILQQTQDVGMTHKHVSYEALEVLFDVTYLRVIVV